MLSPLDIGALIKRGEQLTEQSCQALELWKRFFDENGSLYQDDDWSTCFFCGAARWLDQPHDDDCIGVLAERLFSGIE